MGEMERARSGKSISTILPSAPSHVGLTGSSCLPLLAALQDLLLQLTRALFVFLIPLVSQLADPQQKVVDILGSVGLRHGRRISRRVSSTIWSEFNGSCRRSTNTWADSLGYIRNARQFWVKRNPVAWVYDLLPPAGSSLPLPCPSLSLEYSNMATTVTK